MTEEDFSHALDALRLTAKKAAPAQSKSPAAKWMRWLWIVVAIIAVFALLAMVEYVVMALDLIAPV